MQYNLWWKLPAESYTHTHTHTHTHKFLIAIFHSFVILRRFFDCSSFAAAFKICNISMRRLNILLLCFFAILAASDDSSAAIRALNWSASLPSDLGSAVYAIASPTAGGSTTTRKISESAFTECAETETTAADFKRCVTEKAVSTTTSSGASARAELQRMDKPQFDGLQVANVVDVAQGVSSINLGNLSAAQVIYAQPEMPDSQLYLQANNQNFSAMFAKNCDNGYELSGIECKKCYNNYLDKSTYTTFKKNSCEIEKCEDGYSLIKGNKDSSWDQFKEDNCILDCPPNSTTTVETPKTIEEKREWLSSSNETFVQMGKRIIIMKPGRNTQCYCKEFKQIADDVTKTCVPQ